MRLRPFADRANRAVLALRDQLTPGQRWTAALIMVVVLAVVLYGLPTAVKVVPRQSESTAAVVPSSEEASTPESGAVGRAAFIRTSTLAEALGARRQEATDGSTRTRAADVAPEPIAPPAAPAVAPPSVVALVRVGNGLPGRDDAAMARAFLDQGGFDATVLTYDSSRPTMCDDVAAQGAVVIMSTGPDDRLRHCLIDRGVALVAFDAAGYEPPVALSTRRGARDSLLDLGAWGAEHTLRGKVGLVADASLRPTVDAVAGKWQERGIKLVATAFLGDASAEVPDAVRRFAAAGVEVVVFATPVETQRRWLVYETVIAPGTRHVVSDLFDGVIDESYPANFDGARAHTSLRIPWFARESGETTQQAICRQTWEVTAARMLSSETVPVYAWCQHVALVGAALASGADNGTAVVAALRRLDLASPLTSDLGPLADGGFGPTQDAALTWRASCRCWQSTREFRHRGTETDD